MKLRKAALAMLVSNNRALRGIQALNGWKWGGEGGRFEDDLWDDRSGGISSREPIALSCMSLIADRWKHG